MKFKSNVIAVAILTGMLAWSCSTPKNVTYVQDLTQGTYTVPAEGTLKARPGDKFNIIVNSKDPALAKLFNLSNEGSTGSQILNYTVDQQGNIDYPIIGNIHVAGLTRAGIAKEIKDLLVSRDLVRDATVTVEFTNPTISVLGEVARPGNYRVEQEHINILQGLALAGDLTISGERENVAVIREAPDGTQQVYRVDLTNAQSLYASPAYYLQQNDVIYVEPNDTRKRSRSANGNSVLTPSFWVSIASFIASMAVLIAK